MGFITRAGYAAECNNISLAKYIYYRTVKSLEAHWQLKGKHVGRLEKGTVTSWPNSHGYVRWSYGAHRSHRLGLRCWRWFYFDGSCFKHDKHCWDGKCRDLSDS